MTPRDRASAQEASSWGFDRRDHDDGDGRRPVLVWRFPQPLFVVSSAPLGGGLGQREWAVNAQVSPDYDRDDPERHLTELAETLDLHGPGVGMLTAVDLRTVFSEEEAGVRTDVSVGVTHPTWAADAEADVPDDPGAGHHPAGREVHRVGPGTINVVAFVPERLSPGALVNAVATVTEAKAQALWESGVPATGTASDAVCIGCPFDGPEHPFGGPRSRWGARLARAVHRAVLSGCASDRRS